MNFYNKENLTYSDDYKLSKNNLSKKKVQVVF